MCSRLAANCSSAVLTVVVQDGDGGAFEEGSGAGVAAVTSGGHGGQINMRLTWLSTSLCGVIAARLHLV